MSWESTTTDSRTTEEKRLSDALGKALNTVSMQHHMVPFAFVGRYGSAIQSNMMHLIMSFLRKYAGMYESGEVDPGERMYEQCELSYRMLESVGALPPREIPGNIPVYGVDPDRIVL